MLYKPWQLFVNPYTQSTGRSWETGFKAKANSMPTVTATVWQMTPAWPTPLLQCKINTKVIPVMTNYKNINWHCETI